MITTAPLCPAVRLLGFARVTEWAKTRLKWLATAKSAVTVAALVRALIVPRWAAVKDWAAVRAA